MESQPSVPSAAVAANANVTIKNEEEQDQAKQASNQLENTEIIEEAVEQVVSARKNLKSLLHLQLKNCRFILDELLTHEFAWLFTEPVDAIKLNLPDYHDIISHPMDLGTVNSRLESNVYDHPQEFCNDVRLTFNNAMVYAGEGSDIYKWTKQIGAFFERRWARLVAAPSVTQPSLRRRNRRHNTVSRVRSVDFDATLLSECEKEAEARDAATPAAKRAKFFMSAAERAAFAHRVNTLPWPKLLQFTTELYNVEARCEKVYENDTGELAISLRSLSPAALQHLRAYLDQELMPKEKAKENENVGKEASVNKEKIIK